MEFHNFQIVRKCQFWVRNGVTFGDALKRFVQEDDAFLFQNHKKKNLYVLFTIK